MVLSMSMFASQADYWKARAELAETTVSETVEALGCEPDNEAILLAVQKLQNEVHNLNWALGTPGFDQMATPEEQAESEAATARVNDLIARMAANKAAHDAMEKNGARYVWLRDRLLAADFDYQGAQVLVFEMPNGFSVSADCDATIDSAMTAG